MVGRPEITCKKGLAPAFAETMAMQHGALVHRRGGGKRCYMLHATCYMHGVGPGGGGLRSGGVQSDCEKLRGNCRKLRGNCEPQMAHQGIVPSSATGTCCNTLPLHPHNQSHISSSRDQTQQPPQTVAQGRVSQMVMPYCWWQKKKRNRVWQNSKWQLSGTHCSMALWHRKEPFSHLQASSFCIVVHTSMDA